MPEGREGKGPEGRRFRATTWSQKQRGHSESKASEEGERETIEEKVKLGVFKKLSQRNQPIGCGFPAIIVYS